MRDTGSRYQLEAFANIIRYPCYNSHSTGIIPKNITFAVPNLNKIPNTLRFSCISHLIALLLLKITSILGK